ncbi:hypothetical protein [Actinoplanes sp. NPDC026670]|uniref:hypothetical protein n=1 Tax=Actinoplanes sp. NPDC026670 TaxID=3154700 RepID=UPI0033CEFE2D
MTDYPPANSEIAERLQQIADRSRELIIDLQRRSWAGGEAFDVEIANLSRAIGHLHRAAKALGVVESPGRSALTVAAASSAAFILTSAGVLLLVPEPGQPVSIVMAVIAGWFVAEAVGRVGVSSSWRRITAARDAPDDDQAPVHARIRRIQTAVDEIHSTMATGTDPAEDVRHARGWLALATETVPG